MLRNVLEILVSWEFYCWT